MANQGTRRKRREYHKAWLETQQLLATANPKAFSPPGQVSDERRPRSYGAIVTEQTPAEQLFTGLVLGWREIER